jgi:hypothetical protein
VRVCRAAHSRPRTLAQSRVRALPPLEASTRREEALGCRDEQGASRGAFAFALGSRLRRKPRGSASRPIAESRLPAWCRADVERRSRRCRPASAGRKASDRTARRTGRRPESGQAGSGKSGTGRRKACALPRGWPPRSEWQEPMSAEVRRIHAVRVTDPPIAVSFSGNVFDPGLKFSPRRPLNHCKLYGFRR